MSDSTGKNPKKLMNRASEDNSRSQSGKNSRYTSEENSNKQFDLNLRSQSKTNSPPSTNKNSRNGSKISKKLKNIYSNCKITNKAI